MSWRGRRDRETGGRGKKAKEFHQEAGREGSR
eukprot:CAMPEP_0194350102 /NCGR_PEP_ID=MMETSP0171-20130528/107455_1 /TAXON_ID=218684 /ORGANISM="Corethron pennatum, Strain L29A3" /LENGTH=31 /DNA_ID= /DNA_START= /DNA_END= /DNA_ORIENTATION=